jgi:hypothetical protein
MLEREKIASNERIKAAELAQQRELELLKLNAVEVEEPGAPGPDGKPTKGTSKKRVMDSTAAIMESMGQLSGMVAQLGAHLSAPTEIVRGPDGRAVGTRKVVN